MLFCFLASIILMDSVVTKPVTVTASRFPMAAYKTGRSVDILSQDQIRAMPVASIDELLRYIPSMEVQARGPFGAQADLTMRGSTFNQVLVLIDGMRMNDPLTGHFNGYIPISLAEIHHIEVLRGPAAALYGVDAVGGVVHIITHTFNPADVDADADTLHVHADLAAGAHALVSGSAGLRFTSNNMLLSGGVQSHTSTGFPRIGLPPADFTLQSSSASVRTQLGDGWTGAFRLGADSREFDARLFYTQSTADQSRETVMSVWTQAMVQYADNRLSARFDASYKRLTDVFIFNPTFASTNRHTTQLINILQNVTYRMSSNLDLGGGVQFDYRTIVSTDRGNHETGHAGAYLMAQYDRNNLTTHASLRLDYDENYGWEITPQLNLAYSLSPVVLRASFGRGVRGADFTERFVSHNIPAPLTPGRNYGNPDLRAERSWTWDAGIDFFSAQWLNIHTTYFTRYGSDLIDFVFTNSNHIPNNSTLVPDTTYFFPQNVASVTTQGVEVQADGVVNVSPSVSVDYALGYMYLDVATDSGVATKYLTMVARQLGSARLQVRIDGFTLGAQVLYKVRNAESAQSINATLTPEYTTTNLVLRYQALRNLAAFVQANNVFDVQYSDILGAQMPGRWIIGGLTITI